MRSSFAAILVAIAACEQLPPREAESIPLRGYDDLVENSAAAMSTTQPGVWFTINDSGNGPVLFAFDTAGTPRGSWRVARAVNRDWEAASVGPCGPSDHAECVYIGDTGDNEAAHPFSSIYRVSEPRARADDSALVRDTLSPAGISYRYADGPHDVEAMYVTPDAAIYLITKRPLADARGRFRDALVFRLAPSAWMSHKIATAELVDSLPIVPGSAYGRVITDASLSRDAKLLAVRTYTEVYVFAVDSATGLPVRGASPRVCDVTALREPAGEGITWVNDERRLLLTTEGRRAPIHITTCSP